MHADAVIFGGGAAGLWLLDELYRRGLRVLLLEAGRLGQGQTIASQGILHSGLKYMLNWRPTRAAWKIRALPGVWRKSLRGEALPSLRRTRLRTEVCYLWQTTGMTSRLGMLCARILLQSKPRIVASAERPDWLRNCPGTVARLDEQVISPVDFLTDLSIQHRDRILQIDAVNGLQFDVGAPGCIERIRLRHPQVGESLSLEPGHVIFTAGQGNAELRRLVGLSEAAMQRRPLHMVLVRGNLPLCQGHCIDGAKTRVTITADRDSQGRTVWQVGGDLAEKGVPLSEESLLRRAWRELCTVLPAVDFSGTEWNTYRVDRAEGTAAHGLRPDTLQVLSEGNVFTAWPTKLVLAPLLAQDVAARLPRAAGVAEPWPESVANWPRPLVAAPPWEMSSGWRRLADDPRGPPE